MATARQHGSGWTRGLPARVLALTVLFVMLAEVLIYVPSIARFRAVQLEEHAARAHIAVLALEATPDHMVSDVLERDLLFHASAHRLSLMTADRRVRTLSAETVPAVDAETDLRRANPAALIADAFATLVRGEDRVLRVVAHSPKAPSDTIEIVIDEAPLRTAMIAYSRRILELSIVISLITAGLVFVSLHWLLVRPMLRISESMMRFRANPDDPRAVVVPSARRDEIGLVERELETMQHDLRAALRQKTRLAALGAAVAKINHDLRNALASAVLASDHLATLDDPEVKRVAPRLLEAIDRAVKLCEQTLAFVRDERPPLRLSRFSLRALLADVAAALPGARTDGAALPVIETGTRDLIIEGDRDQLFRVFSNLAWNAAQAGAGRIAVQVAPAEGGYAIDVADDGAGIPEAERARLFQPFSGPRRNGGSGLGLVIGREIVRAHGGELLLLATGAGGTTFRLRWPRARARPGAAASPDASATGGTAPVGGAADNGEKGLRQFTG